jgi:hypothetical protein
VRPRQFRISRFLFLTLSFSLSSSEQCTFISSSCVAGRARQQVSHVAQVGAVVGRGATPRPNHDGQVKNTTLLYAFSMNLAMMLVCQRARADRPSMDTCARLCQY